jgi:hypothetical protein
MIFFTDDDMPKGKTTVVLPLTTSAAAKKGSQEETMVGNPSQDALEKIVGAPSTKHRKKATHSTSASLEAHQPLSSTDNVSTTCILIIRFCVTTQDFIKFWGKIFVFILLVLIENSQGFKTFEFI